MRKLFILFTVIGATIGGFVSNAHAGNCDHSWQTAKDGSRCGGRAADIRPGGK